MLEIAGATPRDRGIDRGRQVAAVVREHWPVHLGLFALAGWSEQEVREHALASLDALGAWWPDGRDEILGVAEGAGVEPWIAAALGARTELLVAKGGPDAHAARECTILATVAPAAAAQVWDWHRELADAWHAQQVRGGPLAFAGITEHGIGAKVGMNEAGVGVLLAILSHTDDRPGGVPVHSVLHRVLAEAETADAAVAIAASAPVTSSSVLTIVGPTAAGGRTVVAIELSPAGSERVSPEPDRAGQQWLPRTNHFLSERLAAGSRTFRGDPDSDDRLRLLRERIDARAGLDPVRAASDLVPMLRTAPGAELGDICCVARPEQPFGRAWQTLATVAIDERGLTITEGSPLERPRPALHVPLPR
ncbi:C45 family peptidase [Agrococcus sp. ARC_14]|uniref:C45 family autoproteolytic acyltransferase/hydolase n=1 Tax=Agrococcus sp. ARC_14 TaxID=2919927 RepID=UPI001F05CBAA|nr:C45 family peptidase [Agrococcus sp. ARC_14]